MAILDSGATGTNSDQQHGDRVFMAMEVASSRTSTVQNWSKAADAVAAAMRTRISRTSFARSLSAFAASPGEKRSLCANASAGPMEEEVVVSPLPFQTGGQTLLEVVHPP